MAVKICVAVDSAHGYAKNNLIPWDIPEDFKHFMDTTRHSSCIMGRNTYEEMVQIKKDRLGDKYNPSAPLLAKRASFVVSSRLRTAEGAFVVADVEGAVNKLKDLNWDVFILGGAGIFNDAMPYVDEIIMTHIPNEYDCDQFFDMEYVNKHFEQTQAQVLPTSQGLDLTIAVYSRVLRS